MSDFASLFQHILDERPSDDLEAQFPFYPLDAPGMPLPGPDFIKQAVAMGDDPPAIEGKGNNKRVVSYGKNLHYLYRRAVYDDWFTLPVEVKGRQATAANVPGHLFGETAIDLNGGPTRAKVMLIGKNPGREELRDHANFTGPSSAPLFDALDVLGVSEQERAEWYTCNIVRWPQLDQQSDSVPQAHKQDCHIILAQELRLVRPDYILCLGSDASKWLLGTPYAVSNMVGRVEEITFPIFDRGEDPRYHTSKVMAVTHPASVYRWPEQFEDFKDQIGLFLQLLAGVDIGGRETDVDHRNIYELRALRKIVDEIRNDPDPDRSLIAVDAEWHGEHPTEPGSYLRTVQFSSRHGEGITVVLRHQGGSPAFQPGIRYAVEELNRLLQPDPEAGWEPRIGGHWFRSDLIRLLGHEGIDLRYAYDAAGRPEDMRTSGGFDTSLMYHAVNETASFALSDMAARLTTAPRYDQRLLEWRDDYCKTRGLTAKDLEGYGDCPAWVLHPESWEGMNYASYDPDVTRRIAVRCLEPGGLLDHDWFGNSSWVPYWIAHRASLGFLEMEMSGLLLDKDRVDELVTLFMEAHSRLLEAFRQAISWASFNPESNVQCVAFLFGDRYATKLNKKTGERIAIKPPASMTLNLRPIKTTGKRPKLWDDIVSLGQEGQYTPSVDKEVLGILGHEHPLAMQLRDLKFIGQVLKGALRRPAFDGRSLVADDDGNYEYDEGIPSMVHADGRVRTHLSQLKETGRASSFRPPLQNISKRREGDYARILGEWRKNPETGLLEPHGDYLHLFPDPLYQHPIRSIFRASPGHVLVEADYTGAELAVIAWMSGDLTMIEHVRRNTLPENHPDHFDIHSNTAVRAFQLRCEPTKKGLKDAGYKPLRVAAKNVNFGIPYGRGAEAIARQCKEEGVDVTVADTQRLIDFYFQTYPGTEQFLSSCRIRSQPPFQWLTTCFGRFRRFIRSRERQVIGEQERQAQNFPIQGTVADAVSRAIDTLYWYRLELPDLLYRMLLQIHDALLFEVPIVGLREFIHDEVDGDRIVRPSVLRECMVNRVPVWPRHLDGTPMNVSKPYYFGIDIDVAINWGEEITEEQCREYNIDPALV